MWRDGARTLEAGLLLATAWLLVRFVRMSRWSPLLGPRPRSVMIDEAAATHTAARVRTSIERAERRLLGRALKCLPRAMAMQWMLARRQVPASLVIGAARRSGVARAIGLHAWVECGRVVVIGGEADLDTFAPLLVLPTR